MTLETTGAQELLEAKILGTMMRRSWDTDFTKQVFQKHGADIDALANSGAGANLQGVKLDLIVETQFEKELQQNFALLNSSVRFLYKPSRLFCQSCLIQ